MSTVLYAKRGTVDLAAATWFMDALGRADVAVVANAEAAKAAHAAGAEVIAVGGPACQGLAGLAGLVEVNGATAVDTSAKLAALKVA